MMFLKIGKGRLKMRYRANENVVAQFRDKPFLILDNEVVELKAVHKNVCVIEVNELIMKLNINDLDNFSKIPRRIT